MAKIHLFGEKILGQPTKHDFELKMLKLLEKNVKTKSRRGYLIFWIGPYFDQKVSKNDFFWSKLTFLAVFGQNFQKYDFRLSYQNEKIQWYNSSFPCVRAK